VQLRETARARDPIVPVTSEHEVLTVAGVDDVIPAQADDAIAAGRAGQHIVGERRR
jgi:hypothetical protein